MEKDIFIKVIDLYKNGIPLYKAIKENNLTPMTFYRKINKYSDLQEKIKEIRTKRPTKIERQRSYNKIQYQKRKNEKTNFKNDLLLFKKLKEKYGDDLKNLV
ncbi:MAG: hypothetical protein LBH46_02165 [Rickettsiales bacterium]|jgi:hypothetical protein|nr:hypothetical protein [Rickettsiales bacterium]